MTLGQISTPKTGFTCGNELDLIQPSVSFGNPYVVPDTGGITAWTLTSWTTIGGSGPEQRALKVFRRVGDPATYQAVAHDGPRDLTPGGTDGNTFPTSLAVRPGDVLGLHMTTTGPCLIDSTDPFLLATTDLADGQSDGFSSGMGRLEVEAVVSPTNTFSLAGVRRNKAKGTATLTFQLPNPGDLNGTGRGARVTPKPARAGEQLPAGLATLDVRATGKKWRKLARKGRVKIRVVATYVPINGDPNKQPLKVKLKKKRKRR